MSKLNCWEITKCGREPGGNMSHEHGICRTAVAIELDGINGGVNGGRICWIHKCGNCAKFLNEQKGMDIDDVESCPVYQRIKREEGIDFEISSKAYAEKIKNNKDNI